MRGVWDGEGNPTRADCIRLAAECATQAAESLPDAQLLAARGWAETAKAWAEIAKVADAEPLPAPADDAWPSVRIALCRHTMTVLYSGGRWLHAMGLDPCDRPPTG